MGSKSRVPRIYNDNFFSIWSYTDIDKHYMKGKDRAISKEVACPCYYILFLQKEDSIIICLFSLTTPCYNVE